MATSLTTRHKKIFLLLGHPDKELRLSSILADAYERGAKEGGHEVKRFNIAQMRFDPILHRGYKTIQELEPDLKNFQEALKWCEHFVVVYPVWWTGMPALLKGLFDRAWLPGVTFRYLRKKDGTRSMLWSRMMRGKSARIVALSSTWPPLLWITLGNYTTDLKWGILWFAGFRTHATWLGPSEDISLERQKQWEQKMERLGRRGI